MTIKFYVHEREDYAFAGEFETQSAAFSYLGGCSFKDVAQFKNKEEDDFVVDQVIEDENGKSFLFYHVTPTESVEAILREGLIPQIGERSIKLGESTPGVYVFPTFLDCETAMENWLGEEFLVECECKGECDEECLEEEIPVSCLEIKLPYDEYVKFVNTVVDYERVIKTTIPKEYIAVLEQKNGF